ncbi:unnamed protein product, partial [Symbiodinium natans]
MNGAHRSVTFTAALLMRLCDKPASEVMNCISSCHNIVDQKLLATETPRAGVQHAERTTETVVEMNNGCICCTLRGDFIQGMQKVLKEVQARGSHLDGVLIETTGLADPSPIASTFFLDKFMQ